MSALPVPALDRTIDRAAVNRANAQYSTGPRTEAGKQRSSLNALRHGLTAASPVLPSEDPAAYESHCRQFMDEYQPASPTETQLVQELIDASWRLNRIPLLEAELLAGTGRSRPQCIQENAGGPLRCAGLKEDPANPPNEQARIDFDIVDAHRLIANLNLQGHRLSRQFQKALDKLREIQADRRECERRDLKDAAALLELYKHKGLPWQPADHGFVFSKQQVERAAERMIRLNEARHVEYVRFHQAPQIQPGYDKRTYWPTGHLSHVKSAAHPRLTRPDDESPNQAKPDSRAFPSPLKILRRVVGPFEIAHSALAFTCESGCPGGTIEPWPLKYRSSQ
jgi:hypothetical protein